MLVQAHCVQRLFQPGMLFNIQQQSHTYVKVPSLKERRAGGTIPIRLASYSSQGLVQARALIKAALAGQPM